MPKKLAQSELRPDLQLPEMRGLMLALLDLLAGRVRLLGAYKAAGASITLLDAIVNLHIVAFDGQGTRAQELVDSLEAPRRTIRDSLARLERYGLIVRGEGGPDGRSAQLYFPSSLTGKIFNDNSDKTIKELSRVSEALSAYRRAVGRITP